MSTPARIYLLHYPDSKLAARLADRIYEWFRLPSLEGIPVYLRSRPVKGRTESLPADEDLADERLKLYLEQKTRKQIDGDVWKFVEAAATERYPGVDLDGPVKRIRLEEVIAEVSKQVPIPKAKPKESFQQP